ncbi:acyltransferase [Celeribacter halophilus]|uniref:acyltransferase n=1 Tax=Celeribacter halophilus TaxID=576117 RepID=UPI003A8D5B80
MPKKSANKRVWAPYSEGPMQVSNAILEECRNRIEPPLKASLRAIILPLIRRKFKMKAVGEGVHWGANSTVVGAWLGNYTSFGHSTEFNGPVVIGDLTMLSTSVQVIGQDHGLENPNSPMRLDFPNIARPVTTIEADCWIGSRVTIMEGIRIGRGSVVGAGSIVTKDIPPYSIVAGSPAKILRHRFSTEERVVYDRRLYGRDFSETR